MKNITTSLYAIAHITNPLFTGALTDGKEYPVFKISSLETGNMITIINDNGKLENWNACFFTFITKNWKEIKMDKRMNKKIGEELQQYLQFRRRGSRVKSAKEYDRRKFKKGE